MAAQQNVSRREFLKVLSVAGVGLVIEVYLEGCTRPPAPTIGPAPTATRSPTIQVIQSTEAPTVEAPQATNTAVAAPTNPASISPGVYVRLGNDGLVTITVPRSELGQGTKTALAMIVAEELCVEWSSVRIEQAPGDPAYGDQSTGGSTSIRVFYDVLRKAGAVGRELMLRAAAGIWNVDKATCYAENNTVIHPPSGKRLAYWELVEKAGEIKLPALMDIKYKKPEELKIIGKNIGRYDNPQIVSGKAVYGIDVRLPGMLFATVARSPVLGGTLTAYNATNAEKVPGVRAVVPIDCGVAVVAENTWAAIRGREALDLTWDKSMDAGLDSAQIEKELLEQANAEPAAQDELVGVYTFPYFAHMTMEPMNCTADVRADRCEVWVPTQNPQTLVPKASRLAGVKAEATRVNVTLVGGAFGRRLESGRSSLPPESDYVSQAVQVSKAVGAPVQVVWTREDDLRYDLFHPISVTHVSAKLDDVKTLRSQDFGSGVPIPTGYWRSVTNPPDAFAHECFLDEYAAATQVDPVELRRRIFSDYGRALAVVELAAQKAGWGEPLPAGYGRGFAYHATWGATPVAEVAEVSVDGDGNVRVHRVVCAVDCGLAINPDMVVAQMESGINFGLTATLKENVRIEQGRVMHSNFHDYPILRFDEMPVIEVYLVPSTESPTGVGEMANPPLAPAVANAVFAATGKRIRRIPIRPEDILKA